jgi:hypothetical protein
LEESRGAGMNVSLLESSLEERRSMFMLQTYNCIQWKDGLWHKQSFHWNQLIATTSWFNYLLHPTMTRKATNCFQWKDRLWHNQSFHWNRSIATTWFNHLLRPTMTRKATWSWTRFIQNMTVCDQFFHVMWQTREYSSQLYIQVY